MNSTQDFNEANFIGKGGYGRVYKGTLSWGGYEDLLVAVKRLDVRGFQGNKEFYTELLMLSQYRHENIITLIGEIQGPPSPPLYKPPRLPPPSPLPLPPPPPPLPEFMPRPRPRPPSPLRAARASPPSSSSWHYFLQ
ncbi:hypothetical protein L6452_30311 [Arctium lappa]|uniref:Uncharacterized protein n=1 Tax=Arctium lappa TaxID=4217 RepID=A0ACB8ZHR5_ARCLA|nr:hypothetical protein L6452_30311 [Arctium lappa]